MQMGLSGWLLVTSEHGVLGCILHFLNYCITLLINFEILKDSFRGTISSGERRFSIPSFLVLTITDRALEVVSTADWETLSCHINTTFLDRRNGQSC